MSRGPFPPPADFAQTGTPRLTPLSHTRPAANDEAVRRVFGGNAFHAETTAERLARRRSRARRFFRALAAFLLSSSPWSGR